MTTGRNEQIDREIDWVQDEDNNVSGYMKDLRTFRGIPKMIKSTASASRSAAPGDVEAVIVANSGSAIVITLENDETLLLTGNQEVQSIALYQAGAGAVSFTAGSGVTIRGTEPTIDQYGSIGIMRVGENEWAYL